MQRDGSSDHLDIRALAANDPCGARVLREVAGTPPIRTQHVTRSSGSWRTRRVSSSIVRMRMLNLLRGLVLMLAASALGACSGSSTSPGSPPVEAGTHCDDLQPTACVDTASQTVCDATGAWVTQSCDALCGGVGFTNKGCTDNKCQCAMRMDDQCAAGADAYCACNSCAGSASVNAYVNCFLDDPAGTRAELECVGQYLDAQGHADCSAAKLCPGYK